MLRREHLRNRATALPAIALVILLGCAGLVFAAAPPATPQNPLSLDDLILLLKMKAPAAEIVRIVEKRGVDFSINPQAAQKIKGEGGDASLLGVIALNQRSTPLPAEPPAEYTKDGTAKGVIAAVPATLAAADRGSCDIEIKVNQTVEITLTGRFLLYDVISGPKPAEMRAACTGPLPMEDRALQVQKVRGRGQVLVLQRPSPQNGYLAKVRVEDPADGDEIYQIRIDWTRH